ncbi:MAG: sulfotransferase domain-containing protein [Planctomycetes bacterium]|nr:sulfotransferase domain-containing protein [Planctomycetota bacterium]
MTATLTRTECLTYPRSGHTLLQRLLRHYFDDELVYCEQYSRPGGTLDRDAETNFQKNHDFQLDTPIRDDRQYLVQVRYPIDSIVSWFKMSCAEGRTDDTPEAWMMFAVGKASFWMHFYRKWVLDHVPGRLIVNYDDLVEHPVHTVTGVVKFLGDETPDIERIERICDDEGVARKNYYTGFRYYGPAVFGLLKGLFAAVPGVDLTTDRLVVPGAAEADAVVPAAVTDLRRAAAELEGIADRLGLAHAVKG